MAAKRERKTVAGVPVVHKKRGPERGGSNQSKPSHPSKYYRELGKSIADEVGYGASLEQAAALHMITTPTIHNWINAGLAKTNPDLEEFALMIEQARAKFVTSGLKRLHKKAESDDNNSWLAQAWLLERVPQGQPYAIQRQRLEVADVSVQEVAAKITNVEQTAIMAKLAELTDQSEPAIIDVEVEEI